MEIVKTLCVTTKQVTERTEVVAGEIGEVLERVADHVRGITDPSITVELRKLVNDGWGVTITSFPFGDLEFPEGTYAPLHPINLGQAESASSVILGGRWR